MAKLIVTVAGKLLREQAMERTPMIFGRDPAAAISVNTPFLSRHHGRIVYESGRYVVHDLGSTNGTHVNGSPISRHVLDGGDVIQVGDVWMEFVDESAPAAGESDSNLLQLISGAEAHPVQKLVESYSLSLRTGKAGPQGVQTIGIPKLGDPAKTSRMFFILFQISKQLSDVGSLDDLLTTSMKLIFEVISADRGLMYLHDKASRRLTPRLAYARSAGFIASTDVRISTTVIRRAIEDKVAIFATDALTDPRFASGMSIVKQSIRSVLCVPLWDEEEVYGALYLDNTSRSAAFTEDDRALLTGIGNLIAVRLRQERLRERLKQEENRRHILSMYHSPDVVDILVRQGELLQTTRREATILFADIQDSTRLAEQLDEVELYSLLNYFYDIAADAIFRQKGHLNKYIGDAVMAVFNAPLDLPDHETKAVACAREIVEKLRLHNQKKPNMTLGIRIGINSGPVISGVVGQQRLEYTVLGDAVNVTERLLKVDRSSPIAMGEATHRKVAGRWATRDLGELQLKGKEKPIRVYELVM